MGGSPESCVVSGTIQDPSGQIFAYGTWQIIFKEAPNSPGPSRSTAVPSTTPLTRYFSGNFDATGSFGQAGVLRNDFIAPAGSLYTLIVAPNASSNAYQIDFSANAPAVNVSAAINAVIQNIQVQAFPVAHAYKDSEVIPVPGSGGLYYDVITQKLKIWDAVTASWIIQSTFVTPFAPVLHNFLTGMSGGGVFSSAQPASADISDGTGTGVVVRQTNPNLVSQNGLMVVYADQFANVQAAINALPATGGTVDARSPNVNLALGTIDVGSDTKPVTLLLGPLSYTADHIVLRSNFRLIGTAPNNISGSGTIITSVGLNTQPLIVNATAVLIAVYSACIENIAFVGLAGNASQMWMFIDVSANTTLSIVNSLCLSKINVTGFKGNNVHLKGSTNTGVLANFIQFMKWDRVEIQRPSGGGGEALRLEGAVGQLDCYNCRFDGNAKGDGNNVYIGMTANADVSSPYSINFFGCSFQGADTAFTGNGYFNVNFIGCHYENLNGVYLLQSTFTNSRNNGIVFEGGYFGNCGVNAGAGYILKATTANVYGASLLRNQFASVHDKTIIGSNLAQITTQDNVFGASVSQPIITTAVDAQMNPAATLNLGNYHTVMLQASGTSITTLNSVLGPGEFITFFANGTCQFATGGNITLPGFLSPLVLRAGETATFVNSDYTGTNTWRLVSTTVFGQKAIIDLTAQSAAKAATLLYAVPSDGQGKYRISWSASVTTAATTSSILGGANGFQAQYTSPTDSVIKTTNPTTTTAATSNANTTGSSVGGSLLVFAKASTNINYLFDYTSVGGTAMQYELHIVIEFLG
jgi:hypothetical protein